MAGLVTGFAGGVGLMASYMVVPVVWGLLSSGSSSNTVSGIAFLAGVGLAYFLGHIANKAIVRRGLDSFGYTGKGIGRVILAIIGAIVGLFIGVACYTPVIIVMLLTM